MVRESIQALGLAGRPVIVHVAMRSFAGAVTAEDLLAAFLAEGCTVVAVTHTYQYDRVPPFPMPYAQNAWEPSEDWPPHAEPNEQGFDPGSNEVSAGLGVFPRVVLAHPARVRARHPIDSLTAVGPQASDLMSAITPLDPYGAFPLMARDGGLTVLMGVDLTKCTAIHWAEQLAGRNLFRRFAPLTGEGLIECCVGSCSEGFEQLAPFLEESRQVVEGSPWRVIPIASFEGAAMAIHTNPLLTRCHEADCARCRDAIAGGPIAISL